MLLLIYLSVFFASLIAINDAARILAIYPTPSFSHQIVFRPITLELIKRGHEVTVITPDPMFPKGKAPKNLTEIDVHDISYSTWQSYFMETARGNKEDLKTQMRIGAETVLKVLEAQYQVQEIQDLIRGNGKFDLLLFEALAKSLLAFSHVHKAPVIQISSFGAVFDNYETVGAPTHPLLYPISLRQRLYNLSMWDKLSELNTIHILDKIQNELHVREQKIVQKYFGDHVPSLEELANNIDMLFLNINPIWEGNRPVPPNVIHMGGLPDKSDKELPTELKKYLDTSKNGVLYLSFGTNVKPSLLPPERIQTFIKVFSKLPYDVLWKWDKDELPGKSSNIKLSKWLPQSDLLKHPKIKLFITQGGLQSTDEAIIAGVPLIGVPMLADQWYNVEKYEHHGIGVKLDLESLSEESLKNAIETVVGNERYRQNILNLRKVMQDQPMRPLDRAMWWIDYVLRHGGSKHLRSPAANITWTQYLELKLVAILISCLFISISILVGILYIIYWYISRIFLLKIKTKMS